MTDSEMLRRFSLTLALACWVPAALYQLFVLGARLPAPYDTLAVPSHPVIVYLVLVPVPLIAYLRRRLRAVLALDASRQLGAARRLSGQTLLAVAAYFVGGAVAVVVVDTVTGRDVASRVALVLVAVTAIQCLYVAIPLMLVLDRLFGEQFGRHMTARPQITAAKGVLAVTLGVTGVASSIFLMYRYVVSDGLHAEELAIGFLVVCYAACVGFITHRSFAASLRPLNGLLGLSPQGASDRLVAQALQPRSLDEIGAVVVRLAELLRGDERVRAELRENEARLRMFAESAGDYFFEWDENLRFSYLSERFEVLTGIPAEAVIGISAEDMANNLASEGYAEHLAALRAHRPYRNYRFKVTRPDGTIMHLQVSAIPYFDANGVFRGYRGTGTNITPIVEAQEQLRRKDAELAQAQKMEVVGQLTGGIAHDFNNLLTVIMGNLELLELSAKDRPDLTRFTSSALAATARGSALVQHLLAFSRRQSLVPKSVDLKELLPTIADLLRRTLGENVALDMTTLCTGLWPCRVDPHQLENAILNLAINARDAMPSGGRLTVTADNVTLTERAPAGAAPRGDYVRISICDTGCGIAPEILPHVFEPFFTTKGPGEGSGLGLSMVYGFTKQSGGDVSISNVPGGGTRVDLLLPRDVGRDAETRDARALELAAGDGQTILVIEDDPGVRAVIVECLEGLGYRVVMASDGDDALARLSDDVVIDLVLSDIVLPGQRSGIDVAKIVRERHPRARILFMSGYGQDEIQRKARVEGSIDVLQKPFLLTELAERVTDALSGG